MAEPLPKWVMHRYAKLWNKYRNKEISYADIEKVLKGHSKNIISVFLNELRNAGWISLKLDEKDARKRNYVLERPEVAIKKMELKI